MFVFAIAVVFKLFSIQFIQGDKYRDLAEKRTVKNVTIPANRGNVYAADGSLLATSVPKYDIRFDAVTPTDYIRFRSFPLLKLGAFKGGLIVEQTTKREHPMGGIAQRTIGYERFDEDGNVTRPGLDGAYGEKYLRGVDGHRLKQKIGKGQWKPVTDYDQVEPKDGYDVVTTIDVNIQDIAHHSLLQQLEKYKADHGCVVVMDVKTGEVKANFQINGSYGGVRG